MGGTKFLINTHGLPLFIGHVPKSWLKYLQESKHCLNYPLSIGKNLTVLYVKLVANLIGKKATTVFTSEMI